MGALAGWLGDNARVALQRTGVCVEGDYRPRRSSHMRSTDLPSPAPIHIHCVAAILWHSQELPVTYDLKGIITRDLLRFEAVTFTNQQHNMSQN